MTKPALPRNPETSDSDGAIESASTPGATVGPLEAAQRRIAALESELAFQNDASRELSDALAAQQLDILTLQRQVRYLSEQLVALRQRDRPGGAETPEDEVPPHY